MYGKRVCLGSKNTFCFSVKTMFVHFLVGSFVGLGILDRKKQL